MERLSYSFLLFLTFLPISTASAQDPVGSVSSLLVSLWPDYDRPSVLVLMTGTLPADAPLPAAVTLPIPASAQLNAVARIDSTGRMIDDILYDSSPGELTLTTPDPRFRVEYYDAYRAEGNQHSYTFNWLANLSTERLDFAVQQPAAADFILTKPATVDVTAGDHGLSHHVLPNQALPAGQSFAVEVVYTMTAPHLSLELLRAKAAAQAPDAPTLPAQAPDPAPPPAAATSSRSILFGAIGVGLVVVVILWQIGRMRAARETPGAEPETDPEETSARFCHACGGPVRPQDSFCSSCGTSLEAD
jgi:hypothetical protein